MAIPGDGDCLWHAFLAATQDFNIAIKPATTANELRRLTMLSIRANRYTPILPIAAWLNEELYLSSPLATVAAQRPYCVIKDADGITQLCGCPTVDKGVKHTCNGVAVGEIIRQHASSRSFFSNFNEYYEIMSCPGSYSEALEIRALSALYTLNIAVWTRSRPGQMESSLDLYFQPKSKGLVVLYNANGDGHYEWLSFSDDAAPSSMPGRPTRQLSSPLAAISQNCTAVSSPAKSDTLAALKPISDWLTLQKDLLADAFAAIDVSFPFNWPASSNGKAQHVLKSFDSLLFTPCSSAHTHSCCSGSGNCPCCKEERCKWPSEVDPWSSSRLTLSAFAQAAETFLILVSSSHFEAIQPQLLSIRSTYLFSRIVVILRNLQKNYASRIEMFNEDELSLIRETVLKLAACPDILHSRSKNLDTHYRDQFDRHQQAIRDMSNLISDLAGLAYSSKVISATVSVEHAEHVIVEGSLPTQSTISSQASDDLPIPYRGFTEYFCKFFASLAADAEKAAHLAQDRLKTVTPINAPIALLQLLKLQSSVAVYRDSCLKYIESLAMVKKQRALAFSASISVFAQRLTTALESITAAHTSATNIPRPPVAQNPKTPSRNRNKKLPPPILSPTQMLHQRTMDAFLLRITKTASCLSSISDGHALLVADERFIRMMDEVDDPEVDVALTTTTLQQRARTGSTASRFMPEAHNQLTIGNSDSHESHEFSSERSSDQEFIVSQPSQTSERLHPRFAQARAAIVVAGKLAELPDILSLKAVHELPVGYCCLGHLLNKRVIMARRSSRRPTAALSCSFCDVTPEQGEIFTCSKSDSFSCLNCLSNSATFSAPPKCPSDGCEGRCSMQFSPIASTCFNDHHIPSETHYWMCTVSSCKIKLCVECAPATSAPQSQTDAAKNDNDNNPASPSSSCSPILNSNANGPGAPMRPSLGH
jgi:hypothetical protein